MKSTTRLSAAVCSLIATVLMVSGAISVFGQDSQKIKLSGNMIFDETGQADATLLIDEQEIAGNPRDGESGAPDTVWYSGHRKVYYPMAAFIDLGAKHQLSDVYLYDMEGKMPFYVEIGEPFNWKPLFTDNLGSYKTWKRHEVDVVTRFIRFRVDGQGGRMPEVVLYGRQLEPVRTITEPEPKPHPRKTMGELIGTNSFIDDPFDKMAVFGYNREYHSWAWDANAGGSYPDNLNAFNPSYAAGGNSWFFDKYYKKFKDAGIMVAPAIQGGVDWLNEKRAFRPHPIGADPLDPASYIAHADYMFQFAARYGSRRVPDQQLKLADNQARVSGLGLLRYVENANEPNAWWHGPKGYATPYQHAAQCSADYDGHMGKLGKTVGVKNADPEMQMSMGGLAGLQLDYIKAMKLWADYHRDGDFPADIINIHHYSNDLGGQGDSRRGISPEDDDFRRKLEEIVDWRNRHLHGKEIWLTEFGYDTSPVSPQGARAIGDCDTFEIQARWILRSYLAIAAAGIDRAAQYMLRDVGGKGKYGTSGFVTVKGEWQEKPSWYYVATLRYHLADMRYLRDVESGRDDVLIYAFHAENGRGAYVLWCPTSSDLKVDNYRLEHLGAANDAKLVSFVNNNPHGQMASLNIENDSVVVNVSEKPVIVLIDKMPQ